MKPISLVTLSEGFVRVSISVDPRHLQEAFRRRLRYRSSQARRSDRSGA